VPTAAQELNPGYGYGLMGFASMSLNCQQNATNWQKTFRMTSKIRTPQANKWIQ